MEKVGKINCWASAKSILTFKYSTIYIKLLYFDLINFLNNIIGFAFNGGNKKIHWNTFTIIIYVIPIIVIIIIIIIIITVILEKPKQGIPAAWSKWWISRFRVVYRDFTASVGSSSRYYLKAFGHFVISQEAPLLVVVGVLYLPLHFIIIVIIIVIITITFIVNIVFIIFIIIRIFFHE